MRKKIIKVEIRIFEIVRESGEESMRLNVKKKE